MAKKQLPTTSTQEIDASVAELRERMNDIRMKSIGAKIKNVREVRMIRKDIARLLTARTALTKKA